MQWINRFLINYCVYLTRGSSSLPDAHFCVIWICIYTNNAASIKYRTKNITGKYFPRRNVSQLHAFANTAVAWWFCESSRHISRSCNLQPHQQRYANKISNPKPQYNFHNYIRKTTFLKSLDKFSFLAAIHLFISSRDEIKISARWIKKPIAVTDCVCNYCRMFCV